MVKLFGHAALVMACRSPRQVSALCRGPGRLIGLSIRAIPALAKRGAGRREFPSEVMRMSTAPAADFSPKGRFTNGPIMRHVLVMSTTGSIGLVAIFLVDFANLFYISLLGDPMLTAAVGYAGTVLYFHMSFCVGLMIAAVALTSRAVGAGDRQRARRVATSALTIIGVVSGALTIVSLPLIDWTLGLVGAAGETRALAAWFMLIALPTTPLLGLVMCLIGILRAVGDAKRSMYSTLILGGVTAVLDPILIYWLDFGITGAAVVMVISRVLAVAYAFFAVVKVHNLIARPSLAGALADFMPLAQVGVPAVLTNIATPVGNGYVTAEIAAFGDHAVAGWTIVARLVPVAFGVLFALSGAIGPIIGQNFGAGDLGRVRRTILDSMALTAAYTLIVSALLFVGRDAIVAFFGASGDDASLVIFFCEFLAISYVFTGGLFVANAAFNNLGFPILSTLFNWGRATIGTVPFVWVGAMWGGAEGALAGFAVGSIPFGIAALAVCRRVIDRLGREPSRSSRSAFWRGASPTLPEGRPSPPG
jgi:putative MATE family efflux protein